MRGEPAYATATNARTVLSPTAQDRVAHGIIGLIVDFFERDLDEGWMTVERCGAPSETYLDERVFQSDWERPRRVRVGGHVEIVVGLEGCEHVVE
jgi:hypothetical protein